MLREVPIESLPRTSPITFKKFKSVGINTYWDLLNYIPFRYEDYSIVSPINKLQEGEIVTIKGEILSAQNSFTKRGFKLQKVTISDGTGTMELVWYNQQYLVQLLQKAKYLSVSGTVERFGNKISFKPAEYEVLKDLNAKTIHTGRLVPIYSESRGLSSKTIREKMYILFQQHIYNADAYKLAEEIEWLPQDIRTKNRLAFEVKAFEDIHFPATMVQANDARRRLAFDELFTVQLSAKLIKKQWELETVSNTISLEGKKQQKLEYFIKNLPFELTGAQQRVTDEILKDLTLSKPMNRFVQGDVGSGKTVVAAIAAYAAHLNGYQTLFMAPTEILAQQHFATISKLFAEQDLKIGLQTGSKKSIKKPTGKKSKTEQTFEFIESEESEYDIIIGTHALITAALEFKKVGLVIIDEQHRFGVAQRTALKNKGINPHLLTMTATPIPRTVALTLYGELDLSSIDEMPKGRLPIKTYLVPAEKRENSQEWIKKQVQEDGVQAYIICPLVEESTSETMTSVKAATKEYEDLKRGAFKEFNVGLLHGKMKPKEKEAVMRDFKEKKYDILVATSVVEVGIDVPNSTVIVIEGAQRFGLAQLHQLRGRVGRGDKQSYCFLFTDDPQGESSQRLQLFTQTNNGLELAEFDFKSRGPGNMFGTQQSGSIDLKVANLTDLQLIMETKSAAEEFVEKYSIEDYPEVKRRVEEYRIEQVSRD